MNVYLVTPSREKRLTEGFAPDDLPASAILYDWLRIAGNGWTVTELQGKLGTGQPFAFGAGRLEWIAE